MKRVEGSGNHLADKPEIRVSLTTMIHQSRQHGFIAVATYIYYYVSTRCNGSSRPTLSRYFQVFRTYHK